MAEAWVPMMDSIIDLYLEFIDSLIDTNCHIDEL